ncbi:MAG: transcription antitermination factor NusB [Proteobacteria bacterium]|nr:transcription antitermination factor NusB [Pseudomonadota bacterium]
MGKRRLSREMVLQALYLSDVSKVPAIDAFSGVIIGREAMDEKSVAFCKELIDGTVRLQKELDTAIQHVTENWEMARLAAVDRCILRLASYELLHHPETPVSVVIDEALEIAKKYSSENSAGFINGILDKVKAKRAK